MRILLVVFCLSYFVTVNSQTKVFADDIVRFYKTFDVVLAQKNKLLQLQAVQTMYVDKASEGLKDFISLGGGNTQKWLNYMLYNRKFLNEMRPYLESVTAQIPVIESKLTNVKKRYPHYKDGNVYFFIGCGFVGGSPNKNANRLLIGAEVLVSKNKEWALPSVIHEFIHLQQKDGNGNLLSQTVNEGVAEFLSELFFEKDLAVNGFAPHIVFGKLHEPQLWSIFKQDMFIQGGNYKGWLYASKQIAGKEIQDLGYFIGYSICKKYYDNASDKNEALNTLLELNLSNDEAVRSFLLNSGYLKADDIVFIKSSSFSTERAMPEEKKQQYGYRLTPDHIVFEFTIPELFIERYKGNIQLVSVAGTFNNWQTNLAKYTMKKTSSNTYRLVIPRREINLTITHQFKFVLNEDIWMQVPETAKNRDSQSFNIVLSAL